MSAETKEAAKRVREYVDGASTYLESAKKYAANTKDPSLIQKITKVAEGAKEISETIKKNLDPKNG